MSVKISFESVVGGKNPEQKEVNVVGVEVTDVVIEDLVEVPKEKKVDTRQSLWDELDANGVVYKKNMSKTTLEELLAE